jgi:hypothetical protein
MLADPITGRISITYKQYVMKSAYALCYVNLTQHLNDFIVYKDDRFREN